MTTGRINQGTVLVVDSHSTRARARARRRRPENAIGAPGLTSRARARTHVYEGACSHKKHHHSTVTHWLAGLLPRADGSLGSTVEIQLCSADARGFAASTRDGFASKSATFRDLLAPGTVSSLVSRPTPTEPAETHSPDRLSF